MFSLQIVRNEKLSGNVIIPLYVGCNVIDFGDRPAAAAVSSHRVHLRTRSGECSCIHPTVQTLTEEYALDLGSSRWRTPIKITLG